MKSITLSFPINPATVTGIVNIIDAKITGITPAELILIGKYDAFEPYALVVWLAY